MNESKARPVLLIGRYAGAGALAGLLVGALEGMYRYRYANQRVLLQENLSYVILFLGPLVDFLAAGFLGLVAGLFVASRSSRIWRWVALILGVCLVAIMVLAIAKNPGDAVVVLLGPFPTRFSVAMRAGVLLTGSAAFIVGRLLPFRTLSVLLAVGFAISLVGVGVYATSPSMHRADIAAKPTEPLNGPNIILISLDTLRADHLSLYGYPNGSQPFILTCRITRAGPIVPATSPGGG